LKTKKHIVYFNWNKIYKLIVGRSKKKHLTLDGLSLIKRHNKNLNRLAKIP
jgi:hypothetical protein